MKKLFLAAGVVLLAACSKDEAVQVDPQTLDTQNKQLEIVVNGQIETLNYAIQDDELLFSQDDTFAKVQEVFNSENLITVINSEVDQLLYFTDDSKFQEFKDSPEVQNALTQKYGLLEESLPAATPKASSLKFSIHKAHSMGGDSYTVSNPSRWSTRHLKTNKCVTGGTDFDNRISSFKVFKGTTTVFYEDPDYRGKAITVLAITRDVYVANLQDLKKKTFTINDGSFSPNYICDRWALCFTSFNDKITSISSSRYGTSLTFNGNACGGSGGGSGGGGGGGGGGGQTGGDDHQ